MRVKEFITNQLQFTDTEGLPVLDWIILREHEIQGTTLFESLDKNSITYLDGLLSYSEIPVTGNQYIAISVMLMDGITNRLHVFGNDHRLTYIRSHQEGAMTVYEFDDNGAKVTYPKSRLSALSYSITYLFTTQDKYDKVNSSINIKFNATLPEVVF